MKHVDLGGLLFAALVCTAAISPAAIGQSLDTSPGWSYRGIQSDLFPTEFGRNFELCDSNGDGWADLVATEPLYFQQTPATSQQGLVLSFPGAAAGLADWDWFRIGADNGTTLGFVAGCAGDLNGDTYADLYFGSGSGFAGSETRMHVQYGSAGGPDGSWEFDLGILAIGVFSLAPSMTAGDVNGDGLGDLIGGFPGYPEPTHDGRVVAFHGAAGGLGTTPDWTVDGATDQRLGESVAIAGDTDGDGFDDLLVADDDPRIVHLYRGSAGGLTSAHSWSYDPGDRVSRVTLARLGDVNGDGYDDFAVAPYRLEHPGGRGQVRVFLGAAGGPPAAPQQTLFGDGSFGQGVSAAGDLNGDGLDDVLVGAPDDAATEERGRVYLFLGSGDGLQSTPAWFSDDLPDALELGNAISGGADIDGDGYTDIVVGDRLRGELHAFYGIDNLVAGPAGAISGTGDPALRIDRTAGGDLQLHWGESCSESEEDFAIYAGEPGAYDQPMPVVCSTFGRRTFEWTAPNDDRFVLVVPQSADREGSHGRDHQGGERFPGKAPCRPQELQVCPSPRPARPSGPSS